MIETLKATIWECNVILRWYKKMIHIWIKYEEKRENKYNAPISGFVADLLLFELVSLDVYLNYVVWFAVSEKLHRQYVKIV